MSSSSTIPDADVYVVLDSNAMYNAFVASGTLAFKTLSAHVLKKRVCLCVPEIVLLECLSQVLERVNDPARAIKLALNDLLKIAPKKLHSAFKNLENQSALSAEDLSKELKLGINAWIKKYEVHILPIKAEHGRLVITNYFDGGPPFKRPKNRDDIPDAYVWQALNDVSSDLEKDVHFVCADAAFSKHIHGLDINVTLHSDLHALLKSGALPITIQDTDFQLARALKKSLEDIDTLAKDVIHSRISDVAQPMPPGVALDPNAGPFQIEKILALKALDLDKDSIVPVGTRTCSLAFTAQCALRATFESEADIQEGTFELIKTKRFRGDYDTKISGSFLLHLTGGKDGWHSGCQIELENIILESCKPLVPPAAPEGKFGAKINAPMHKLKKVVTRRKGIIFIGGGSATKRGRAASVLLNDIAVEHPDAIFINFQGKSVKAATGNVHTVALSEKCNWREKVEVLEPDGFVIEINNQDDVILIDQYVSGFNKVVIAVTSAKTLAELEHLSDHVVSNAICVTAR